MRWARHVACGYNQHENNVEIDSKEIGWEGMDWILDVWTGFISYKRGTWRLAVNMGFTKRGKCVGLLRT
jgi:hypothetical protein